MLGELRALRQWMSGLPDEGKAAVCSRLDAALLSLETAVTLPDTDIFIG
ncbi:hypothetical protein [Corallococcus terminator]|nr:hypothetical protein [Corallococcus terminator]